LTRGLMEQRLGMQEETAKQTNLLHQGQLAAAEAKIPKDQQPFNPSMVDMAQAASVAKFGPTATKAMVPMMDKIKEVAATDPKSTFGDAYQAAISFYPTAREGIINDLSKQLASGKLTPDEQQKVSQLLDLAHYDKTGESFLGNGIFKNTAEAIKQREENSKSAINAEKYASLEQRTADKIASAEKINDANHRARMAEIEARIAAGSATKQDKSDAATEKVAEQKKQKTVNRLDDTLDEYHKSNKELEKSLAVAKESKIYTLPDGSKMNQVDYIKAQIEQNDQAISQTTKLKRNVLSGTVAHDKINWEGNGAQPAAQSSSTTITSQLSGKEPGRYRIAGQEVKWDGTKVIQ
jgi:hypothetical protein